MPIKIQADEDRAREGQGGSAQERLDRLLALDQSQFLQSIHVCGR